MFDRIKRISYSFICIWLFTTPSVLAHSGNTDSEGGHTCRTNCDEWGLEYGEYHFHNDYDYSYEDGYEGGYDSTDDESADKDESFDRNEEESLDLDFFYNIGFLEGADAALKGYVFDDYESEYSPKELQAYQDGYYAGYIEEGGGKLGETIQYYAIQKHLAITLGIGTILVIGVYRFVIWRKRK